MKLSIQLYLIWLGWAMLAFLGVMVYIILIFGGLLAFSFFMATAGKYPMALLGLLCWPLIVPWWPVFNAIYDHARGAWHDYEHRRIL